MKPEELNDKLLDAKIKMQKIADEFYKETGFLLQVDLTHIRDASGNWGCDPTVNAIWYYDEN